MNLETSIQAMTGYRYPVSMFAPPISQVYKVCPHCKRAAIPVSVRCDSHQFIGDWQCAEHGSVVPMNSAVVNNTVYKTIDWS